MTCAFLTLTLVFKFIVLIMFQLNLGPNNVMHFSECQNSAKPSLDFLFFKSRLVVFLINSKVFYHFWYLVHDSILGPNNDMCISDFNFSI